MDINVAKLHQELVSAGIPIEGVAATEPPRIDFSPEATKQQRVLAGEILAKHVPEDYQDKRHKAYLEHGITYEALVTALWEQVVEGQPDAVDALQKAREEIKQQFPS